MNVDDIIEQTLGHEGGYSFHPNDTGGETMWGVTRRVAEANGYKGKMRDMPRERAKEIYRNEYLVKPGFAAVAQVYPAVGAELFDTGVNMGQHWPSKWLQMCLNALNDDGRVYADLVEDGDIGTRTMVALSVFKQRRGKDGEEVLVKMLNCLQGARYIDITRGRTQNESFIYGWFKNRIKI
jgi:lysozyme family protein